MYRVITTFRDLEDGHLYQTGDPFPHDAREIRKERLESLISGKNQAGLKLVEQIGTEPEPKTTRKRKPKE